MGWESNSIFQVVIIQGSPGSGLFVYSPTVGAGNLVASIAAANGTDPFGNAYLAGVVDYGATGGTHFAVALASPAAKPGSVVFYSAPAASGPWTQQSTVQGDAVGNINLTAAVGQAVNVFATLTASGLATLNNGVATSASQNAPVAQVTNNQAAPASPIEQITAAAAGDFSLGIQVSGDTNQRFRADSTGKLNWGTGAAATDTDLFRAAAGVLQTDSTLAITNQAAPATLAGAAQLYAASGQPAYKNPQGLLANLSGGQLAAVNQNTVTQTAFTNLASATIPAADAVIGATYKLTAFGAGTWGSTQQQLNFGARFGSTAATTAAQSAIAATAFAASAAFEWWAEVIAVNVTTGAGATWQLLIRGAVTQTLNPILPGTAADNSVPFASGTVPAIPYTLDSTIAETLGVSASWGSTTGAPTLTKTASVFERIA